MEEFSKEKFYYDMLYIFGDISRHHPNLYYKISKEELDSLIKNYLTDDKIDTYEKSMNYLNEIFVKIGDSHTTLNTYNNPLPIKFNIVDGECIVTETYNQNHLLGATLKSINGIDINTILSELKEAITPRTDEGIMARCEQFLSNKVRLNNLPSIKFNNELVFTFEKDGKEYTYTDNVLEITPNYLYNDNYYGYTMLGNDVIITFKKCRNMEGHSFADMVREISEIENVDGYIIDIRGNEGGNSEIINPLIEFLKGKKCVTLVDKYVFSSGIMALKKLKDIGSIVVGTGIAETANSFGDVLHGSSPNYKIDYHYSTKYFTLKDNEYISFYGKEEYDNFFANEENKQYQIPMYFTPDVYAQKTKEDILNNNDSVILTAMTVLENKMEETK